MKARGCKIQPRFFFLLTILLLTVMFVLNTGLWVNQSRTEAQLGCFTYRFSSHCFDASCGSVWGDAVCPPGFVPVVGGSMTMGWIESETVGYTHWWPHIHSSSTGVYSNAGIMCRN